MTELVHKQVPLDQASRIIMMTLAGNRKLVEMVDAAFEPITDAAAKKFKRSKLISPAMKLRHTLKDAMSVIDKGENNA